MNKKNENVNNPAENPVEQEAPKAPAYAQVVLPKSFEELNVRTEPSMSAKVITKLKNKAKIKAEEIPESPEWVKVTLKDQGTGYCMKKYVSMK